MPSPQEDTELLDEANNTREDKVGVSHHPSGSHACGKNNAQSNDKKHMTEIMEIIKTSGIDLKEKIDSYTQQTITKLTLENKARVDDTIEKRRLEMEELKNQKHSADQVKEFTSQMNIKNLLHKEELKKNNKKLSLKEETISKMQFQIEEMSREIQIKDDREILLRGCIEKQQKQLSEKINILSDMDFNNLKMQEELEQLSRKSVAKGDIEATLRKCIDDQDDELKEKNEQLWMMERQIKTIKEKMELMSMQIEDKEERTVTVKIHISEQKKLLKETNEKLRMMESQNFRLQNEMTQMMPSRRASQMMPQQFPSFGDQFFSFQEDRSSILTSTDGNSGDMGDVDDSSQHDADPDDTHVRVTSNLPNTELDNFSTSTKSSGPPSE